MKLFSWMHPKSKKDTTGSFKGSVAGCSCASLFLNSSLDNQGDHVRPRNNSNLKWQTQDCHHSNNFGVESYEEVNTREQDEIFPGFLTIGTLSLEQITEPPTPTFGEETNEEGIADIKYDLQLISDDLEKFLNAEMEGKNVIPSNKKSQASSIALDDEVKEEVMQLYPLQGYLLGSSTEQRSSTDTEKKEKLLQITPSCHNNFTASAGCAAKPLRTVEKLNKIKSLFQKKIHPEIGVGVGVGIGDGEAAKEPTNVSKYENGKIPMKSRSAFRKSNGICCWTSLMNRKNHRSKADPKLPPEAIAKTNLDLPTKEVIGCAGREHWIKTDAEYFVLEL